MHLHASVLRGHVDTPLVPSNPRKRYAYQRHDQGQHEARKTHLPDPHQPKHGTRVPDKPSEPDKPRHVRQRHQSLVRNGDVVGEVVVRNGEATAGPVLGALDAHTGGRELTFPRG